MNLFEIIGYPLFFVAGLEILLAFILLRHNPTRSPINRSVAAFSFFSASFSLGTAIMYTKAGSNLDFTTAARATWVAWLSIPAALQFIYYLADNRRRARIVGWILYPFWSLVLLLSLSTRLIVAGPYTLIPYRYSPGPLDTPARIIAATMVLWIMVEIVRLRRKVQGVKRAQLDYFFYGILIFAGGGSFMGGFLQLYQGFGFDPTLSSYFSFPWVILTFYAITRHRLFDIPLLLSRAIGIVLLSSVFAGLQILFFELLVPELGNIPALIISLTMIGIVFFGTPFNRRVQLWIQRIVVGSKYDYQLVLKETLNAVTSILDLDELLNYILGSIQKSLGVRPVCLLLAGRTGRKDRQPGGDGSGWGAALPIDDDAAQWLEKRGTCVTREELDAAADGEECASLGRHAAETGAEVLVPLLYKGRLRGLLTLGPKRNADPYIPSDLELLESLAQHAAVAIENALLYEEVRQAKESLQESEGKFRTLAQTTPAGIFMYQGDKIIYANPAAEAISGYRFDDLRVIPFSDIIHPDDRQLVMDRSQARLRGEPVQPEYEFRIVRKKGEERWVVATAGLIEFGGAATVIGSIYDVTARKRAEEEKSRFYEERMRLYRERVEEEKRHLFEKEKLLMDLHDGIGGITTNIGILAEVGQKCKSVAEVRNLLSTITSLSKEGITEVRSFMHSLDSRDTDWKTMAAELRNRGLTMLEPHDISFRFTASIGDAPGRPGSLLWVNIFKIYQEALTNVIKHAEARHVTVALTVLDSGLSLDIDDDGNGLRGEVCGGRGIQNMMSRARELGGATEIAAADGTTVSVMLPFPLQYNLQDMGV